MDSSTYELLAMPIPDLSALVVSTIVPFVLKLVGAVALWIAGGWLIQLAMRIMRKSLRHSSLDVTVVGYLINILAAVLRVILVVAILGFFGIQTASFAALLAGAGVAIGAAWSGMLGNFAAGAFMLVLRPFKVGDFVQVAGITGTVHELGLFGTTLITPDNVLTLVGNGKIFGDNIMNYSSRPTRRVERVMQVAGAVDPLDAIARLRTAVAAVSNVVNEPAPEVSLLETNLLGHVIAVRPYCHTDHYWQVYFDTNETMVRVAKEAGWPAPTPATKMIQVQG